MNFAFGSETAINPLQKRIAASGRKAEPNLGRDRQALIAVTGQVRILGSQASRSQKTWRKYLYSDFFIEKRQNLFYGRQHGHEVPKSYLLRFVAIQNVIDEGLVYYQGLPGRRSGYVARQA